MPGPSGISDPTAQAVAGDLIDDAQDAGDDFTFVGVDLAGEIGLYDDVDDATSSGATIGIGDGGNEFTGTDADADAGVDDGSSGSTGFGDRIPLPISGLGSQRTDGTGPGGGSSSAPSVPSTSGGVSGLLLGLVVALIGIVIAVFGGGD